MSLPNLPVRVWLARRQGSAAGQAMDAQEFRNRLCESFIPVTHQWMRLFGMTDYLVSLWPQDRSGNVGFPDESALVFYPSITKYDAMRKTPTGKLYSASHALIFDSGMNRGGYPVFHEVASGSVLNQAYFGFDVDPDFNWSQGPVWALALRVPVAAPVDWVTFCVKPCLDAFPQNRQWIAWATTGWLVLWVRCRDDAAITLAQLKQQLLALDGVPEVLWMHRLGEVRVPDDPLQEFTGVDLIFDQSARVVS